LRLSAGYSSSAATPDAEGRAILTQQSQFHLLRTRRFLPLFVTQFLGALNDNIFKNALVILVTYRLADRAGVSAQQMATLAAGLFILPFFLFSATAGRLADRFDKSRIIVAVKASEILFMGLAAWGFFAESLALLLLVLFLMGLHSTVFGPIKYGILPVHLREDELLGGNGLIEAGTYLAILLGTISGGVLILTSAGVATVSVVVLAVAAAGLVAGLFVPRAAPAAPGLRIPLNIAADTLTIVREATRRRELRLAILGISWFWLVGATFLSQFPVFAKDVLGVNEHVVTLFLTAFSVGIGIGSLLCNRLLKGEISAKHVPFGALGMTIFTVDLYFASRGAAPGGTLIGAADYLADWRNWRVLADLVLVAVTSGIYIVPLYAILQASSEASSRSRVIAANNIVNAGFMVGAAVATMIMLKLHFSVPEVFLVVAIANLAVTAVICRLLPDAVVRGVLAALFRLLWRVEVHGAENAAKAGPRTVVVVNHVSFIDGALLATFLPGRPVFAIDTFVARQWWVRPFLRFFDAFPLDPTNPMAVKALVREVEKGRTCVIFPEGRITVTGALMKIYEGPGMIADKAGADILPVRIDGAQYTPFSRLRGKLRLRLFPKITLTLLPPRRFAVPETLRGRARRQAAGRALYDVMTELVFATCDWRRTLFAALVEARAIHGGKAIVVEDPERRPISYDRLVAGSLALGRRLARLTAPGERVGLLLPNAAGAAVAFFALQATGRVVALLNFTTGLANMQAACRAAEIRTVVTSRRFLELAKLGETAAGLGVRLVLLEDLRDEIRLADKLYALAGRKLAARLRGARGPSAAPAVVLFTSGSEGTPKGVVLSHENILANRYQLASVVDFSPTDTVFNALPIFHSFGLTGGLLLPLLSGVKTFLYPSPLHFRIVPELAYDANATILFGTDTFLAGYARTANPYDFYSVRYVFAGAERVRDETRRAWSEKFGIRILEGYGATETAPVIAVNTPMHFRAGTVGRPLPALELRLEPVPGIAEGGRLVLRGPNVMLGYLRADRPGVLEPPPDGWYDTGDIVKLDADRYVTIVGRAKRFAKVAGEMVSLAAVEQAAAALWPAHAHAVVALPDPRKGEILVLVTEAGDATRDAFLRHARAAGLPEFFVPRAVVPVPKLPVLGTGKTDYAAVQAVAERATGAPAHAAADEAR
jgi:acyl-[acyl-carrier-protein]-phospholipid O-acyltransferase/long-chain-fatty-acid--[acyl-carrier-protein] ligase